MAKDYATSSLEETREARPTSRLTGNCPTRSPLGVVVAALNQRFGTDLDANDALLLDQWIVDLEANARLADCARRENLDAFRSVFDPLASTALRNRAQRNAELLNYFSSEEGALQMLLGVLATEFRKNARYRDG